MQGLGGRVLVIGCGGLGGYVAEELARLNVDYLILVDGDYYTESNMNRQIGALFSTLGKNKAEVMLSRVRDISKTHVKSVPNDFTRYNAYLIDEVDIVVDCVDNIETRLLIEEECEKRKKVLIHGAVDGIMGQCMICYPGERRLSKMYRKSKDVQHKTYSFVVALVASIQVALVYSVLKHEDEDTKGKLFMLDLGVMETRVVKL